MVRQEDAIDLAIAKREREQYITSLTNKAITEYGESLGRVFAQYVLYGHISDKKEALRVKNDFYGRIVTIMDNGNSAERILAFRAMFEANELFTENRIREANSPHKGLYG